MGNFPFTQEDVVVVDAGVCLNCHGVNDNCIPKIKLIVEDGNVAFMVYAEHVREKIEELGYRIIPLNPKNQPVPIGMYIFKDRQ